MKRLFFIMMAAIGVMAATFVACETEYQPKYQVALDGNATGAVDVTFDSGKGHFTVNGDVSELTFKWGTLEEEDAALFASVEAPQTLEAFKETATPDQYDKAVAVRDAALQAVQVTAGEAGATYRLHVLVYFQEPVTGAVLVYEDEFVNPLKDAEVVAEQPAQEAVAEPVQEAATEAAVQ